jgi:hypothetical protein
MLSRDDWAAAALDALTDGGVNAVAIEPVAPGAWRLQVQLLLAIR